jgi:hypothetical protein
MASHVWIIAKKLMPDGVLLDECPSLHNMVASQRRKHFAASSSPVNRNGEILSFDNEDRAREMRSAQCQARVLYRALHRRKRAKCFGRWWGRADTCKADCFLSFSLGGLFGSPANKRVYRRAQGSP